MRQFAVIGLGSFGFRVARELGEKGHAVLALDRDPQRIDLVQPHVTRAICTDVTTPGALSNIGMGDIDCVVVSLGNDLPSSVLVTMSLKEQEVKEIIVKGISREHRKILEMLGATRVIFPEEDAALRLARVMMEPGVLDLLTLVEGYSIIEIEAPDHFDNKSLLELNLRRDHGMECLAIKKPEDDGTYSTTVIPGAEVKIYKGDRLVVLAQDDKIVDFAEIE